MRAVAVLAILAGAITMHAQRSALPPLTVDPFTDLVNAERAFAAAASVRGWRTAFLEFFADDAVTFQPEPVSALDGLRSQQARPPSEEELVWEPRTGDIASSGDLGWLTGPSTFVNHTVPGSAPSHGNYLSIWKRGADGQWRVFIDVGTRVPSAAPFPPGAMRMALPMRFRGEVPRTTALAGLLAADRALNARTRASNAALAYAEAPQTEDVRLHRNGSNSLPAVGALSIAAWHAAHAGAWTFEIGNGDVSRAGDLGYTYGTFTVAGATTLPSRGAYVRVWALDRAGRWLLEADVTVPTP